MVLYKENGQENRDFRAGFGFKVPILNLFCVKTSTF